MLRSRSRVIAMSRLPITSFDVPDPPVWNKSASGMRLTIRISETFQAIVMSTLAIEAAAFSDFCF